MSILKISSPGGGFFSCCSQMLEQVVVFFNEKKHLPDIVDSSELFSNYKLEKTENLTSLYFSLNDNCVVDYQNSVDFNNDKQFTKYDLLDFNKIIPFVKKYFSPSDRVKKIVSSYEIKYNIDYNNTCAVLYRGNDKYRETGIASYKDFILPAKKIKKENPKVIFLVQTDESEFLDAFLEEFPDSFFVKEIPRMNKKDSCMFYELPKKDLPEFGANFLGVLIVLSKCKFLITHSGNCGMWCVLYRGNSDGVYQWLKPANSNFLDSFIRFYKKSIKKIKNIFNFL